MSMQSNVKENVISNPDEETCTIYIKKTKDGRDYLSIKIESKEKAEFFVAFKTKHYERRDSFRGDFELVDKKTGLVKYKADRFFENEIEHFRVSFLKNNYTIVKSFITVKNLNKVNSDEPDFLHLPKELSF